MNDEKAETVVTPATEPTPAPAVAVAEKPSATTQAAPETKQTTTGENPSTPSDPKEAIRAAYQKRKEDKAVKQTKEQERIAALEAELKAEREKSQAATQPANDDLSILENPQKFRAQTVEEAKEAVRAELKQAQDDFNRRQAIEKTGDHLLTRSHIKQDKGLVDVVLKFVDSRYAHIAKSDPEQAMRLAYDDVCRSKGIQNDWHESAPANFNATQGKSSAGVSPSAPGSSSRSTMTAAEAKALIASHPVGSDGWRRALAEVEKADREGRVKK